MPAKNLSRIDGEGIYCHIYNKGIDGKNIFSDEEDYDVFISFLQDYLTPPKDPGTIKKSFEIGGKTFQGTPHLPKNYHGEVEIVAYSLEPNHFHLLFHQVKKGAIEKFLRSLGTRYSMYYNKKYKRNGALFEGPYKSIQITQKKLMPHLTRYLHYGAAHSSYQEYLGQRSTQWIKPHIALSELRVREGPYKEFVEKYPDDQKGHELIHHITLDSHIHHSKSEIPLKTDRVNTEISNKTHIPRSSLIGFTFRIGLSLIVFTVLVNYGMKNVSVNSTQAIGSTSSKAVLGKTEKSKPSPIPTLTPTSTVSPTPEELRLPYGQEPEVKPGEPAKKNISIKVEGEKSVADIRIGPTDKSPVIGEAKNGEVFELISKEAEWYQVKLENGTVGYIFQQYVIEEENE